MVKNIAYLGPALSFCEEAAMTYSGTPQEQMLACAAISEVFAAVDEGKALQGIVPIENSCEGSVNETLDLLAYDYFLAVTGETIIPVEHHALMRKEMQAAEPTRILSHPQALAQCRRNLKKLFPYVQLSAVSSTAEAARMVAASDQPWAALASAGAACAYGLLMVQKNMHDHPNNETRFVVIGKKHNDYKPGCKTSLLIHTQHAPGALFNACMNLPSEELILIELNPDLPGPA
jgi:prephenate dehydratase